MLHAKQEPQKPVLLQIGERRNGIRAFLNGCFYRSSYTNYDLVGRRLVFIPQGNEN